MTLRGAHSQIKLLTSLEQMLLLLLLLLLFTNFIYTRYSHQDLTCNKLN